MLKTLKSKLKEVIAAFVKWALDDPCSKPATIKVWEKGNVVERQICGFQGAALRIYCQTGEEIICASQAVDCEEFWIAWEAWKDTVAVLTWENGEPIKREELNAQR